MRPTCVNNVPYLREHLREQCALPAPYLREQCAIQVYAVLCMIEARWAALPSNLM